MTLREVTIGRDKNSDIYLDDRCAYASNNHATIYYDGNQLMFRDNSSNGTMINNIIWLNVVLYPSVVVILL